MSEIDSSVGVGDIGKRIEGLLRNLAKQEDEIENNRVTQAGAVELRGMPTGEVREINLGYIKELVAVYKATLLSIRNLGISLGGEGEAAMQPAEGDEGDINYMLCLLGKKKSAIREIIKLFGLETDSAIRDRWVKPLRSNS